MLPFTFIAVPPEGIELLIDKTNVTVSDRVTMECRVKNKGRPTAKISWYHNNKLVPEGNNAQYLYSKKEIEINDAGPYRCVAKNEAAEIKSKVRYIDVRTKEDEGEGKKILNFTCFILEFQRPKTPLAYTHDLINYSNHPPAIRVLLYA